MPQYYSAHARGSAVRTTGRWVTRCFIGFATLASFFVTGTSVADGPGREPAFTEVVTESGQRFSNREWNRMSPSERQAHMSDKAAKAKAAKAKAAKAKAAKAKAAKAKAAKAKAAKAKAAKVEGGQTTPQRIAKPPFSASPLGQPLSPQSNVTDNVRATPTPNSAGGGYAGLTRSGGSQLHGGLDDPGKDPTNRDVVRYTGTTEGTVTRAGPAYKEDGTYLGERVTVSVVNKDGVWESKTMHHEKALVKAGETVRPGAPIAIGTGQGDQFKSPQAGAPHVHWEVTHNGQKVDPVSGNRLPEKQRAASPENTAKQADPPEAKGTVPTQPQSTPTSQPAKTKKARPKKKSHAPNHRDGGAKRPGVRDMVDHGVPTSRDMERIGRTG